MRPRITSLVLSLSLLTLVGLPCSPFRISQAIAVPPVPSAVSTALDSLIACKFGWRVFNQTPEGIRIANSLLGRPVQEFGDLKLLATRLEAPELKSFSDELVIRLSAVREEMVRYSALPELTRTFLSTQSALHEIRFLPAPALQGFAAQSEEFLATTLPLEATPSSHFGVVPLRRIPLGARAGSDRRLPLRSNFGADERLYLGLSSHGDFSFVLGTQSYVGQIVSPPLIAESANHTLKHGLIVRFDALPLQVAANLKTLVTQRPQSINISCVNGVCSTLAKAGIQLGGAGELPIYRSRAIERMVRDGFSLPSGKRVAIEVYMNSQASFDEFFENYARLDKLTQRYFSVQAHRMREQIAQVTAANLAAHVGYADPSTQARLLTLLKNGVPTVVILLLPFSVEPLQSGDAPTL